MQALPQSRWSPTVQLARHSVIRVMGESTFRSEDGIGLMAAIFLHGLLVLALAAQIFYTPHVPVIPERMTVSLATEVSLESTAPDPVAEAQAAIAPTLSDEPIPQVEEAPAEAAPAEATPPPRPQTPPERRTQTRTPPPDTSPRRRPDPPRQTQTQTQTQPRPRPRPTPGASRLGDNFLDGPGAAANTDETRLPANQIGRTARASIVQAISRQLKPYWDAPSGLEADQLVTVLSFKLNEDGSLAGRPRVVRQRGITDSNRPQAPRHAEQAIRAVQRAAPFDLPDEYYNVWKSINGASFDRNLSR